MDRHVFVGSMRDVRIMYSHRAMKERRLTGAVTHLALTPAVSVRYKKERLVGRFVPATYFPMPGSR